jgi:putative addiction module killer protein
LKRALQSRYEKSPKIPCIVVAYRLQTAFAEGGLLYMIEVRRTEEFSRWLHRLRDDNAAARIVARIRRAELGNLGDYNSVGGGVMEMRVDYGPGYRVYFARPGDTIVILLCGGDKSTQRRDIKRARELMEQQL